MKKLGVVLSILLGLSLSLSAYAQGGPLITVINDSDNPVPVEVIREPSTPREVHVTNIAPIPVTGEVSIIAPFHNEIVSKFLEWPEGSTALMDWDIMAVPSDKKFVLTDVHIRYGSNVSWWELLEDNELKFREEYNSSFYQPLRLASGIVFDSESLAHILVTSGDNPGGILVSGYLVNK
jgi:hypothetical protein